MIQEQTRVARVDSSVPLMHNDPSDLGSPQLNHPNERTLNCARLFVQSGYHTVSLVLADKAKDEQVIIQPFPQIQSNPRHKSVSVTSPLFKPFLAEHEHFSAPAGRHI